jgi:hypothetical protein
MPDFVTSLDELYAMPPDQLLRIRDLLDQKAAHPKSVGDADWMALFGDAYADIGFTNGDHFGTMKALSGDLEGTNLGEWADAHAEALALAASGDPAQADRARATEAFGSHFLADAFSAGHLFDKDELVDQVEASVDPVERKKLVVAAAKRVWQDHPKALASYEVLGPTGWGPLGEATLVSVFALADVAEPRAFANAPAGAAHDALCKRGVLVQNDVEQWLMFGDDRMDPTSTAYATLATERARDEVEAALAGEFAAPADVMGLVPRPTYQGMGEVESTVDDVEGDGLLDALVQQLESKLEAILDGAVAKLPILRQAPEAGAGSEAGAGYPEWAEDLDPVELPAIAPDPYAMAW